MSLQPTPISRRSLFLFAAAGAAAPRLFAASDFWNKKDPKDWTSEEIGRLTTNSPWAKEVSATFPNPNRRYQSGGPGGVPQGGPGGGYGGPRIGLGIPGIGIGGGGLGGGGRRGGMGRGSQGMMVKGTVVWQSAQPILDGVKPEFPKGFENHYVIAVTGFPWPPERNSDYDSGSAGDSDNDDRLQRQIDDLKTVTYLRPHNGNSIQPGIVNKPISTGNSILFGFSKDLLKLSADDKDVTFTTRFGRAPIEAKFNFKDMKYQGKLAI